MKSGEVGVSRGRLDPRHSSLVTRFIPRPLPLATGSSSLPSPTSVTSIMLHPTAALRQAQDFTPRPSLFSPSSLDTRPLSLTPLSVTSLDLDGFPFRVRRSARAGVVPPGPSDGLRQPVLLLGQEPHHPIRGLAPSEQIGHELHGLLGVDEEGLQPFTEPVQARLSFYPSKPPVSSAAGAV